MTPEKARQLEQFTDGYTEALYWSSTDERDGETVNLDDYMTSTQADDKCRADCLDFFTENYDALTRAAHAAGDVYAYLGDDELVYVQ